MSTDVRNLIIGSGRSDKFITIFFVISDTKHVMISYQWDVQRLVIQLKNKLQAEGYKVWMDIDEMGGSTLESMATAVENASVVLVCVSQKYKESPNCRSGNLVLT